VLGVCFAMLTTCLSIKIAFEKVKQFAIFG